MRGDAAGRPRAPAARAARAGTSIVEVVCGPAGLEVYERSGEGALDALEERLHRLGLRLAVRRRGPCG